MLKGSAGALGIVHDQGADMVVLEFTSHYGGGNFAFLDVGQHVDIKEEPVRQYHQTFDAAVEKHFKIAFKAIAFVMHIGKDRQERRLIESVLHAAQHERAVWVGHVGDHDPDRVAATAAQRAREQVGTIAELRGGALDSTLGSIWNVASQGRVVQDDGNGG